MDKEEIYTQKNLKITDLADRLEISQKDLSQYIFETYGNTFSNYINDKRIQKVIALLQEEDARKYTLLAVAENAGFSSKSTFNSVFKKMTGLTPSQYRTKHLR